MSRIRSRGNKETEGALVTLFRNMKLKGWRRHRPVYGKPDFIFPKNRVAVFVDGCFWHGCPRHGTQPKTNAVFWKKKITANKARDRVVNAVLRQKGWIVVRIWEHELRPKNSGVLRRKLSRISSSNVSGLPASIAFEPGITDAVVHSV